MIEHISRVLKILPKTAPREMRAKFEVILRKVAGTFVVTIPKPLIDGGDWKEKDKLEVVAADHDGIVITNLSQSKRHSHKG